MYKSKFEIGLNLAKTFQDFEDFNDLKVDVYKVHGHNYVVVNLGSTEIVAGGQFIGSNEFSRVSTKDNELALSTKCSRGELNWLEIVLSSRHFETKKMYRELTATPRPRLRQKFRSQSIWQRFYAIVRK
jgi:hypothetical protein